VNFTTFQWASPLLLTATFKKLQIICILNEYYYTFCHFFGPLCAFSITNYPQGGFFRPWVDLILDFYDNLGWISSENQNQGKNLFREPEIFPLLSFI